MRNAFLILSRPVPCIGIEVILKNVRYFFGSSVLEVKKNKCFSLA
jgi:hypothetical protein